MNNDSINITDEIFNILKEKGFSEADLATYLGKNQSTISTWKSRKKIPNVESILRICEFLDIDINVLYKIKPTSTSSPNDNNQFFGNLFEKLNPINQERIIGMIELKLQEQQEQQQYQFEDKNKEELEVHSSADAAYSVIYRGQLAAGKPIHHFDDLFEVEYMQSPYPQADFAWQVVGDSMEPDIADGSIIYTRTVNREEVCNGDTVVVNINGEYNCKNIYYFPDQNLVELHSINPLHETQQYYLGDETDTNLKIEGKVIF